MADANHDPKDEIEITPEMVEAAREYFRADGLVTVTTSVEDSEFIAGLYRAMYRAANPPA